MSNDKDTVPTFSCSQRRYLASDLNASDYSKIKQKVNRKRRSRWFIILRMLFGGALIFFLLRKVGIRDIANTFTYSLEKWHYLVVACMLPVAGIIVSALRWQALLQAQKVTISLLRLSAAILIGNFYNQFLPSTIGGDIMRSWWISKLATFDIQGNKLSESTFFNLTIVAVDRLLGLLGICGMAVLALAANPMFIKQIPETLAILGIVIIGILLFFFLPNLPIRFTKNSVPVFKPLKVIFDKALSINDALNIYRKNKFSLFYAFLLSMGLQALIICQYWFLSSAFKLECSILSLAALIPIVNLVSMIPITINGIGIRENALILLGVGFGLNASGAISLAWGFYFATLIYASFGGFLNLYLRRAK